VGRALDQRFFHVEELVFLPVQLNAEVGAAIAIQVNTAITADRKQ
jgi:hypothetical protein